MTPADAHSSVVDRPPLTDGEAAAFLETLDQLYGRPQPMQSRAETVLAAARSVGDEEAITRIEAVLNRLGEDVDATRTRPSDDSPAR